MYKVKFFVIILILAIAFVGCSKAVQENNEDCMEPKVIEVIKDCEGEFSLKGTKWRFKCIYQ